MTSCAYSCKVQNTITCAIMCLKIIYVKYPCLQVTCMPWSGYSGILKRASLIYSTLAFSYKYSQARLNAI